MGEDYIGVEWVGGGIVLYKWSGRMEDLYMVRGVGGGKWNKVISGWSGIF